jgi:aspartate/methionine/tyrosine aminotransferase/methylase of polypeptide subunit release factors
MGYLERARELLNLLRNPETRALGEEAAAELERRSASGEETELVFRRVAVEGAGELRVLVLPSVFAPEEWGRTFLRGLLERPRESYRGTRVVELGAGSGWVSIALAKATEVARIYALDLNPQAAMVTEINAYLNGVSDRIEAGVSDLLASLKDVTVDLVCGNIPQVLAPEAVARAHELTEDAPARVLRMLGDYTPPTGNFEDVLSLGLIANALERTLDHLSPEGRIVLNLAGRPGFDVIRWVFARWGYALRVLHKETIRQDPGTDISPFARAEEETGRSFSFYAARGGDRISAVEAVARRSRGEDVFHDLYVVEGRPYRQLAVEGARRHLETTPRISYTEDPGSELEPLRDEIAIYLACYLRLAARRDEVFLAPSIADLERAIALALPDGLVAALGTRAQPDRLGADRLAKLLGTKRPLVLDVTYAAITSIRREPSEIEKLLDGVWRREDVILVLDLGEHFRTGNLGLAVALVGPRWKALQHTAEATYSRAPAVPQGALLHLVETLNERYRGPRPGARAAAERKAEATPQSAPASGRASSPIARELAALPAFEPVPAAPRRIRLDFGESEFPVSERMRKGILDGIAATDKEKLEREAREACARYLSLTRGVAVDPGSLVLGAGAQELVLATIRAAAGPRRPLVLLPRPFYGLFPAVALAAGAELQTVGATIQHGKLALDEVELRFRLRRADGRPCVLLLANPNNPTGLYLDGLDRLLAIAREAEAVALVDEVFFTLSHTGEGESALGAPGRVVVVEGLSKSFAAGGVRFGCAWVGDADLAHALRPSLPTASALGAARGQLADFEQDLEAHVAWLASRVERTLTVVGELGLEPIPPSAGLFLAVDFTPLERKLWTGSDIWGTKPEDRPEPGDFRKTLALAAGLVVSPDHWSGWALPHRRFVFSIADLEEALVRLRAFTTVLE